MFGGFEHAISEHSIETYGVLWLHPDVICFEGVTCKSWRKCFRKLKTKTQFILYWNTTNAIH